MESLMKNSLLLSALFAATALVAACGGDEATTPAPPVVAAPPGAGTPATPPPPPAPPPPAVAYTTTFTASAGTYANDNSGAVNITGTGTDPVTFVGTNGPNIYLGSGTVTDLSAKTSFQLTGLSVTPAGNSKVQVNYKGLTGFGNPSGNWQYDDCTYVHTIAATTTPSTYTFTAAAPNRGSASCAAALPTAAQALSKVDAFVISTSGAATLTVSKLLSNQ